MDFKISWSKSSCVSVCAVQQEESSPAETLFSFIVTAFVYLLSVAFHGSGVGSGERFQLSAMSGFVVDYLYLVMLGDRAMLHGFPNYCCS